MEIGSYIALSGQLALERRMETLAGNVANANTPGFRSGQVRFGSIIAALGQGGTAFSATGEDMLNLEAGGMTNTGNPLDIAINGTGFFAFESQQGLHYSRDGRLKIASNGEVQNLDGHRLLGSSGSPLLVDPSLGSISVTKDGSLSQAGRIVGQVGLFAVDASQGFTRRGSAGIVPAAEPELLTDYARNNIAQGFVEGSNVNPVTEMVKLIEVTRAFESASSFAEKSSEAERNAIEALGSG
jgi:flagellar basal-body rod protein FlgF